LALFSTRTKKKETRKNKYINPTAALRQVFRKPTGNKGVVCKTGLPVFLPLLRDLERPLPVSIHFTIVVNDAASDVVGPGSRNHTRWRLV